MFRFVCEPFAQGNTEQRDGKAYNVPEYGIGEVPQIDCKKKFNQ